MKKIILISLILVSVSLVKAQQLPNAGFESWTDSLNATDWTTGFNFFGTDVPLGFRSDIARNGNYSMGLATINIPGITVPASGIATLGIISPNISTSTLDILSSIPFTGKPTKLNGYFLYNHAGDNIARIRAYVYNNNDTIAEGVFIIDSTIINTWTAFEMIINYPDTNLSADAINVILESSIYDDNHTPVVGSVLLIDDLLVSYNDIGLNNFEILDGIKIYPNPSSDYIKINNTNNENFEVSIYNSNAQLMYYNSDLSHYSIDISAFPKATYFVKCNIGNKVYSSKFITE